MTFTPNHLIRIFALVFVALLVLGACGSSAGSGTAAKPRSVQLQEAASKTPAACGEALDAAERVFDLAAKGTGAAGEALGLSAEAIKAVVNEDVDEMQRIADEIRDKTDIINEAGSEVEGIRDTYNDAASECRDSL